MPRVWNLLWGLLLAAGAPAGETPVAPPSDPGPADYRVGAGDILEILSPRYPEFSKQYPVSRDGAIAVDLLGEVSVDGRTTDEIRLLLERRLSEYLRRPEGLTVRVVARRMLVRVLGHVGAPGLREVSKDANVQEILAAAGGPLLGALTTRLELRRRQGEWIESIPVDLKAYLEGHGKLPEVRHGDEIFVPRVETEATLERPLLPEEVLDRPRVGRVQVLGAVAQPGEVRLTEDSTLLTVLTSAGGWLPTADLARIKRVPGGRGEAVEIDLQRYLDHGGGVPAIGPGDVLTVPSRVVPTKTIKVVGAVAQPGPVQLTDGADVQAALAAAGGPTPAANTRAVKLIRYEGGNLVRREIDLEAWLASGDPALVPALVDGDTVFVPKGMVPVVNTTATVYLFGLVGAPGPYPLVEQRPLLHVLAAAGGPAPTADLRRIKITRADPAAEPRTVLFDLLAYQEAGGELPPLVNGDTITLEPNLVTVVGQVAQPGPVAVDSRATVVEALARAGGPAPGANLARITLTRPTPAGPEHQTVNLEQYLYEPAAAPPLPRVQAGDVIAVETGTVDRLAVYVLGAVQRPGVVELPGQRASVLYVLAQAGGVLPFADREQVRIVRPGAGGTTSELFDLKALTGGQGGPAPEVRPGDIVSVDELGKPGRGVLVLGAVARQGRLLVEEGQTVIDTLGLAGGLTPNADPTRARLVRADGEALALDLTQYTKTGARSPAVRDGDLLVIANQRNVRDIWDEILRVFPFVSFVLR